MIMEHESVEHWREVLKIKIGMTKEQALEQFTEWQGTKTTCSRCKQNEYNLEDYCPIHLVCEEVRNGKENRTINIREKISRELGNSKIDTLQRITTERLSVDKFRR